MTRSTASFREMGYFSTSVGNFEELDEREDANDDAPPEEGGSDREYDDMLEDAQEDPEVSNDDDDDPDDLSDLGLPKGLSGTELGSNIIELWRRRRTKLVSDFAIAGWLLSPLEEVRGHVKQNREGYHDTAMDRILQKMYHYLTEEELGNVMDTFWTEYDTFVNRTGASYGAGRKYIWNSELLRQRHSAQWHAQYSLKSTKVCVSIFFVLDLFISKFAAFTNLFLCCVTTGTWSCCMSCDIDNTGHRFSRAFLGCCEAPQNKQAFAPWWRSNKDAGNGIWCGVYPEVKSTQGREGEANGALE